MIGLCCFIFMFFFIIISTHIWTALCILEMCTPIFHGSYKLGELSKVEDDKTTLPLRDIVQLSCPKGSISKTWEWPRTRRS